MQKYMRWSAVLVVLMFVLAACQSDGGSGQTDDPGNGNGNGGGDFECEDEIGCVTYAPGEAIRIGSALVISGPDASLGLDSQYGVQVAIELRGEIHGHEIELDAQDDGCNAEGGTAAARTLTSDPTIVAVIGTSCSSAGVPAAQITSDAGVVMISPSNTAPSLTSEEEHQPFYLRTAHNDTVQGEAMARFVCEELGFSTAATMHDGSPYAEQLQAVFQEQFAEQCDGTITGTEAVEPTQTDFNPVLTSLAAGDPEFLYYPIFTAAGALVTQQARDIMPDTVLAGADGMFSDAFLEAAGSAADGMYLSGPDLEFSGTFYQEEFLPAYSEVSGEDAPISVFHAHAYDAATMIFDAIEEVATVEDDGTIHIGRQALRDALFATSGFEGITGSLTCNATGDCADPSISVSEVVSGAFQRIWP
ncbi:MAG TPA: branched-chain amino acid ABC transporter substrate-binding protein [Candidatus Angelobacter sp.]|nr:branched-chain amino acid ABC transporter substrate-binding protein [Candidatus Angelobacter sp.]